MSLPNPSQSKDPLTVGTVLSERQLEFAGWGIYQNSFVAVPTGNVAADGTPEFVIQTARINTGGMEVMLQDQTTSVVFILAFQEIGSAFQFAVQPSFGDYTFEASAGHGLIGGEELKIEYVDPTLGWQYMTATVLNVVANTVTLDTAIVFAYPADEDVIQHISTNMNVDGSVTPQKFVMKLPVEFDATTLNILIVDEQAMDDSKFGSIAALTNGLLVRGEKQNLSYGNQVANFKTNGEFRQYSTRTEYYEKSGGGLFAFYTENQFAGQAAQGVALRIETDYQIAIIIQDDLTALSKVTLAARGHLTN